MPELIIQSTVGMPIAQIAEAMCVVWESDADTPGVYAEHCRVQHADLAHSVVGHTRKGEFVGIGIISRRGSRGFVLDFGIAPAFRRLGFGHSLFSALLGSIEKLRLEELSLLVSTDNVAAIRIYKQANFQIVRELVTLIGRVKSWDTGHVRRVHDIPNRLMSWYGSDVAATPQWERELSALLAMAEVHAFEGDAGFVMARRSPYFHRVECVHIGLRHETLPGQVASLLGAVHQAFGAEVPLSLPEEPTGSRASQILRDLGFYVADTTYEMRLDYNR